MFDIIGTVGEVNHMAALLNHLIIVIWRRTEGTKRNEDWNRCSVKPNLKESRTWFWITDHSGKGDKIKTSIDQHILNLVACFEKWSLSLR